MKFIKRVLRSLQFFIEKSVVSSFLQNIIWKYRHLYTENWADGYLQTIEHHHRQQILDQIDQFEKISNIVELGSGPGANLAKIAMSYPEVTLLGIDINKSAVEVGGAYVKNNDLKIELINANINNLSFLNDNSFDLVLTDATLMFITPPEINHVIKEMIRIARKGLILNEFNLAGAMEGVSDGGRWIYDLEAIIEKHRASVSIYSSKSDFNDDRKWRDYGKMIRVHFE